MPYTSASAAAAQSHYSSRAANYDQGNGGWHVELGRDFVSWLSPIQPGSIALDLACGTGLVTLPLTSAIGAGGKVVGVDITRAMLDIARGKPPPEGAAAIEWVEHDVTDLENVPEVQRVVQEKGGFEVISCCSALVLLPSASAAVRAWSKLLRPGGGRMIVDVPTEDRTLQYIFTCELREVLGLPNEFDRSWVKDVRSLEKLFEDAGLKVTGSWRTRSYVPEKVYEDDEWEAVLDEQVEKYKDFVEVENAGKQEVRDAFRRLWKTNLNEQGRFRDGHWLYVVIGMRE